MPTSCSMKATRLKFVEPASKIYYPYDPQEEEPYEKRGLGEATHAGIAFTRIGDGWLGYIGDVNNEEGTWNVILAMIGMA